MSSSKNRRLDDTLIARGDYPDRAAVRRAVIAGDIFLGEEVVKSPAVFVADTAMVRIRPSARYVSRGGEKLAGALDGFEIDVTGWKAIDVGASTGGFTDCLLQRGAASVTSVDVGYGQFAWKLRQDKRVRLFERTNIKTVDLALLGAPFDLVVADLSFISLARLAPIFAELCGKPSPVATCGSNTLKETPIERAMLHQGRERAQRKLLPQDTRAVQNNRPAPDDDPVRGSFLGLIKPQFEAKSRESDRGVIRDPNVWQRVIDEVEEALRSSGFSILGIKESALVGPAGNHEFFVWATLNFDSCAT